MLPRPFGFPSALCHDVALRKLMDWSGLVFELQRPCTLTHCHKKKCRKAWESGNLQKSLIQHSHTSSAPPSSVASSGPTSAISPASKPLGPVSGCTWRVWGGLKTLEKRRKCSNVCYASIRQSSFTKNAKRGRPPFGHGPAMTREGSVERHTQDKQRCTIPSPQCDPAQLVRVGR